MKRRQKIYEGKAKILYKGNKPYTLIQYFKDDATAYNAMKKIGIEDAFDMYLGGDSNVGIKKTGKPAIYACEKLGLIPENVISIGDAKMDFDMAQRAGLKGSILVSTGQNTIQQLKKISETSIPSLDYLSIKVR